MSKRTLLKETADDNAFTPEDLAAIAKALDELILDFNADHPTSRYKARWKARQKEIECFLAELLREAGCPVQWPKP